MPCPCAQRMAATSAPDGGATRRADAQRRALVSAARAAESATPTQAGGGPRRLGRRALPRLLRPPRSTAVDRCLLPRRRAAAAPSSAWAMRLPRPGADATAAWRGSRLAGCARSRRVSLKDLHAVSGAVARAARPRRRPGRGAPLAGPAAPRPRRRPLTPLSSPPATNRPGAAAAGGGRVGPACRGAALAASASWPLGRRRRPRRVHRRAVHRLGRAPRPRSGRASSPRRAPSSAASTTGGSRSTSRSRRRHGRAERRTSCPSATGHAPAWCPLFGAVVDAATKRHEGVASADDGEGADHDEDALRAWGGGADRRVRLRPDRDHPRPGGRRAPSARPSRRAAGLRVLRVAQWLKVFDRVAVSDPGLAWFGSGHVAKLIDRRAARREIHETRRGDWGSAATLGREHASRAVVTNSIVFREGLEAVLILAADLTASFVGVRRRPRRPSSGPHSDCWPPW